MTPIETTSTTARPDRTEPRPRREARAESADFGGLFAQFAQSATLGAARNGSLSLGIGGGPGRGSPADAGDDGLPSRAQKLQPETAGSAPDRPSVRDQAAEGPVGAGSARSNAGEPRSQGTMAAVDRARGEGAGDTGRADATPGTGRGRGGETGAEGQQAGAAGDRSQARGAAVAGAVAAPGGLPGAGAAQAAKESSTAVSAVGAGGKASGAGQQGGGASLLLGGHSAARGTQATARTSRPQPAAPTAQQARAFGAQLMQGLGSALRRGRGEVTLRLRPETLGELRVRMQIKGSTVDAQFRPSTMQAHRLLEQSVDALRQSFEARGLQVGRIEIEPPSEGKEAPGGGHQPGHPDSPEGRLGPDSEGRSSRESAGDRTAGRAGGVGVREDEEDLALPMGLGSPGIVYSVADGAARILSIDALA